MEWCPKRVVVPAQGVLAWMGRASSCYGIRGDDGEQWREIEALRCGHCTIRWRPQEVVVPAARCGHGDGRCDGMRGGYDSKLVGV